MISRYWIAAAALAGALMFSGGAPAQVPPLSLTTNSLLPAGAVGMAYSQTFRAQGGQPPYQWASDQPPSGLSLNATTGVLSGTPQVKGQFSFRVQVTDSAGTSALNSFALTINAAPLVVTTDAPLFNATVGTYYAQPFSASGGTSPYTWSLTGDVPGLALDGTTGILSGTPTADGSFPITVQVADTTGLKVAKSFVLTVQTPKLTITTGSPLPSGSVGVAYSQRFLAVGGTAPYTWSVVSGTVPGLALNGDTLSGTPTSAGSFTLSLQARDTAGVTAVKSFSLPINPAALSLATGTQLLPATAGQAYTAQIAATGGVLPYTWSQTGIPDGLALDPFTGLISGTPTAPGSFAIAIKVTDGALANAIALFRITVGIPSLPPVNVRGLPAVANPAGQYAIGLQLDSPFPLPLSGQLLLSFNADSGGGDSTIQFSTGGRTADFNIPANTTTAAFAAPGLAIQTGTVAGNIVATVRLSTSGNDVTPSPAPSQSIRIERSAPVISGIKLVRSGTGLEVQITGFSTALEVTQGVLTFTAATGSALQTAQFTVQLQDLFASWFQSAASVKYGSQFTFAQPFNVQGDPNAVSLESVTLSNRIGSVTAKP